MTHLVTLWSRAGQREIMRWEYGKRKTSLTIMNYENRSTAYGFHGVTGHRMGLETANRYEMNVTSLLDIMAWHCVSGMVGCVGDICPSWHLGCFSVIALKWDWGWLVCFTSHGGRREVA